MQKRKWLTSHPNNCLSGVYTNISIVYTIIINTYIYKYIINTNSFKNLFYMPIYFVAIEKYYENIVMLITYIHFLSFGTKYNKFKYSIATW